jgi:hypothetical protein
MSGKREGLTAIDIQAYPGKKVHAEHSKNARPGALRDNERATG